MKQRRLLYYGEDAVTPDVEGKVVILVDDGIATGLTMEAAVRAVQNKRAKHVIVAAPVASPQSVEMLDRLADGVVVLDEPQNFMGAIGAHYYHFDQVDDEEVRALLREVRNDIHRTTAPVN
jgi:predicted phosphoribosyltransferase